MANADPEFSSYHVVEGRNSSCLAIQVTLSQKRSEFQHQRSKTDPVSIGADAAAHVWFRIFGPKMCKQTKYILRCEPTGRDRLGFMRRFMLFWAQCAYSTQGAILILPILTKLVFL